MVFLFWEKTGNDSSKATEISNSLFICRFRSRFFLQIYSLSANKTTVLITSGELLALHFHWNWSILLFMSHSELFW